MQLFSSGVHNYAIYIEKSMCIAFYFLSVSVFLHEFTYNKTISSIHKKMFKKFLKKIKFTIEYFFNKYYYGNDNNS